MVNEDQNKEEISCQASATNTVIGNLFNDAITVGNKVVEPTMAGGFGPTVTGDVSPFLMPVLTESDSDHFENDEVPFHGGQWPTKFYTLYQMTYSAIFEFEDGYKIVIPEPDISWAMSERTVCSKWQPVFVKNVIGGKERIFRIEIGDAHGDYPVLWVRHEQGNCFLYDWAQRLQEENARCVGYTLFLKPNEGG